VLALLLVAAQPAPGGAAPPAEIVLFADVDDDDDDGVADRDLPSPRAADLVAWDTAGSKRLLEADGDAARVVSGGRFVGPGARLRDPKVGLLGLRPGEVVFGFDRRRLRARVFEIRVLDAAGERVDLAASHASISRTLPAPLSPVDEPDTDALRWVVIGPPGEALPDARVVSTRADRTPLDEAAELALSPAPCPADVARELTCAQTELIRATADVVDRSHPSSASRSLRAEVGGRLELELGGSKAASIRVGGPRRASLGRLDRLRLRLRVRMLRAASGGEAALGGDDSRALERVREELRAASALWGQCGISFGPENEIDAAVADPPPAWLLAVGCDLGLPASGGEIALRAGKRTVRVPTRAGQTPAAVAHALAVALRAAGLRAEVSMNARIEPGALRTADVLVRGSDGQPLALAPLADVALSSDASLRVCLGEVDLADGLQHFGDLDAVAGTVEERALIKAFDDGDPATVEVLVIPRFGHGGRIGESFIHADGSSVRNVVVVDVAGVRSGGGAFTLAHELGHILLDLPGHPDDYGVDSPTSLMDADAADPTIFGPRRLSLAECERAVRQSGPAAPVPLLEAWPLVRRRSRR
jgi:hypothetical protein